MGLFSSRLDRLGVKADSLGEWRRGGVAAWLRGCVAHATLRLVAIRDGCGTHGASPPTRRGGSSSLGLAADLFETR